MNRKKLLVYSLIPVVVLLLVYAVHGFFDRNDNISIIYIPKTQDPTNDFWTTLIEGANMAAKEYNIDLTIWAPNDEADYEKQNELLLEAARKKPDVIAFSPASYTESNDVLTRIKKEYNIPVILIDSAVSEDIQTATVASNNIDGGNKMGVYARGLVEADTKIAVVAHVPNSSTAIEREKGFREGLGEYEDRIVKVVYSYSDFTTAYEVTKELLTENPDITLIAGLNEYSAVGAGKAIKDMNLAGRVRIIGFDNSIAAVNMLEEKIFCAIVIQKPFNMGYIGIETAYRAARKESFEKNIDSGCELITMEDMYTDKGQKSLFSFLSP